MIEVIPAILPKNFTELSDKLTFIRGFTRMVQIDVCDSKFVPSQTFPFGKGDASIWERITSQEQGLPLWEDFDFEADLMVRNPFALAREWVSAGALRIVLHLGSDPKLSEIMDELRASVQVGLAILPGTKESEWAPFLTHVDFIQVMGISPIGYQGQTFRPSALLTIAEVRKAMPTMPISVDGAVSPDNALSIVVAGATRLVAGTAIFESDDPRGTIEALANADSSEGEQVSDGSQEE
jgi:ribulose-phosphate 3-epimerase